MYMSKRVSLIKLLFQLIIKLSTLAYNKNLKISSIFNKNVLDMVLILIQ